MRSELIQQVKLPHTHVLAHMSLYLTKTICEMLYVLNESTVYSKLYFCMLLFDISCYWITPEIHIVILNCILMHTCIYTCYCRHNDKSEIKTSTLHLSSIYSFLPFSTSWQMKALIPYIALHAFLSYQKKGRTQMKGQCILTCPYA